LTPIYITYEEGAEGGEPAARYLLLKLPLSYLSVQCEGTPQHGGVRAQRATVHVRRYKFRRALFRRTKVRRNRHGEFSTSTLNCS